MSVAGVPFRARNEFPAGSPGLSVICICRKRSVFGRLFLNRWFNDRRTSRDIFFFFFFYYERAPPLRACDIERNRGTFRVIRQPLNWQGRTFFPKSGEYERRVVVNPCSGASDRQVKKKKKANEKRKKTVVACNKLSSLPISEMKLYFVPRFADCEIEAAVITRFCTRRFHEASLLATSQSRSLSLPRVYENRIEISLAISNIRCLFCCRKNSRKDDL